MMLKRPAAAFLHLNSRKRGLMKKTPFSIWDWLFGRIPRSVKVKCQDCDYSECFIIGVDGIEVLKMPEGQQVVRSIPKPPKHCPKCGSSNLKTSSGPPLIY